VSPFRHSAENRNCTAPSDANDADRSGVRIETTFPFGVAAVQNESDTEPAKPCSVSECCSGIQSKSQSPAN